MYSMAILLHEEGLYEKSRIYATDMNSRSLQQAKEGVFDIKRMKQYTRIIWRRAVPARSLNIIQRSTIRLFSNRFEEKHDICRA